MQLFRLRVVVVGLAVHFSYSDLEKQGKLSSDVLQPWKRVLEDVLILARQFKQVSQFLARMTWC